MGNEGGTFYRVFENLDELVSVVETARGVLVSGSCVVPRGHVLDLLDDLRDALPAEMEEAHEILEQRADLLDSAQDEARRTVETARAEAERQLAAAQDESEQGLARARGESQSMLAAARTEAQALLDRGRADYERAVNAGRAEHDRLVAETEVHRSATARSTQLLAEASANADRIETEASARAERIGSDAEEYVEAKLADFAATLTRTLRSVEAGRGTLRERQASGPAYTGQVPGPAYGADQPRHLGGDPVHGAEFYDQDAALG